MAEVPMGKDSRRLIVTTSWDYGQKFDLRLAKLLAKYGIKGTFYANESYRPPYLPSDPLTKEDMAEICEYHELGAHTLTHPHLSQIPLSEAKNEIESSKAYLEEMTGHRVDMFCYPYGDYDRDIKKLVAEAGFIGARTTKNASVDGDFCMNGDPYELKITMHTPVKGFARQQYHIWKMNSLSLWSIVDWERRATDLFTVAMNSGGVYHIWGHGWEFEYHKAWDRLERVIKFISNRENVLYMTNGEMVRKCYGNDRRSSPQTR